MIPTFMYIEDGSNLIRGSKICWWLTKTQIEEIINSCNRTLRYYDKNNFDDEIINQLNDQIFDEEYGKSLQRITEKIKTNVYVMIDHNTKYYKIGRSNSPLKRERTLQSEKPTIELIHKFECEYGIEKELHNKFNDKKVRGEWFKLDDNDIKYIKTYYK